MCALENENYLNASYSEFWIRSHPFQLWALHSDSHIFPAWIPATPPLADIFLYAGVFVLSCFSHVWVFMAPWTVPCQVHSVYRISWQSIRWISISPAGDLPNTGTEPWVSYTAGRFLHRLSLPGSPIYTLSSFWTSFHLGLKRGWVLSYTVRVLISYLFTQYPGAYV